MLTNVETAETATITAAPRLTLYDITFEGTVLQAMLEDSEGELTPEIEARLDLLLRQGPDKIEAAAKIVRQLESWEKSAKEEATRLKARAESFANNAERLKARMVLALDAAFSGKIKTPLFTIWTQKARDTVGFGLAEEFALEMFASDYPDLVKTEFQLDSAKVNALWEENAEKVHAALAVLQQEDATDAEKAAAREVLKVIPEGIVVDERQGKRYVRIR